jgi:ribosomal protein L40E
MNNNNKSAFAPVLLAVPCEGAVPENVGTRPSQITERVGKLSRIAHFQRLEAARQQPGNCRRCGKPNPTHFKACDRCRKYNLDYKLKLKNLRLAIPSEVSKVLAQFRRELSHLRATVKNMSNDRRRAYRAGYQAGLAGRRARFKRGAWIPPQMSMQELSTINHAYQH